MICPTCEHQNPESNRFCGMCGCRLSPAEPEQRPTQESAPVENSDGSTRRPFIVSTTAMADVTAQMLNSRVVLPSPTLASSHSGYTSPLKPQTGPLYQEQTLRQPEPSPADSSVIAEEEQTGSVHEIDLDSPEKAEAERWLEQTAAEHESRMPPPVSTAYTSGSILGLGAPVRESTDDAERPREPEPVHDRNSFLYIEDATDNHRNDVSGPSFLGLGSDEVSYEEEQPTGRGRLLLLLAMFAIVVVLGALEWRASQNGESTNPMDVLHLKLPKKKGQGQVRVVPPSSDSSAASSSTPDVGTNGTPSGSAPDNSSAASASTPGKPDLIAESNLPAKPKSTADNTSASSPPAQHETPSQPNAASATPPSVSTIPAKSADSNTSAPAKPTQVADANTPAPSKPAAATPTKLAKPAPSKPAPATAESSVEPDASLSGGAFELQKGKAAGPTELGRMWLWKATAKGNGEAPVLLGDMYAQGNGVPKDCEQAMLILNAAAKKMNVRARSKLGSMYAAGQCVPQDRVKAYKWMSSALEANPGSEWLEKNRESLLRDMTPAERQRASR